MDRGSWRATAHRVTESDTAERLTLSLSTRSSHYAIIFINLLLFFTVSPHKDVT